MMISEVEPGGLFPASLLGSKTLTPRDLALSVDRHLAALWRGDENVVDDFFRWLTSLWSPTTAPEPATPPDAVSVLGAGGVGIRWYETGSACVGYVEGRPGGCYRVPITTAPPRPQRAVAGVN